MGTRRYSGRTKFGGDPVGALRGPTEEGHKLDASFVIPLTHLVRLFLERLTVRRPDNVTLTARRCVDAPGLVFMIMFPVNSTQERNSV